MLPHGVEPQRRAGPVRDSTLLAHVLPPRRVRTHVPMQTPRAGEVLTTLLTLMLRVLCRLVVHMAVGVAHSLVTEQPSPAEEPSAALRAQIGARAAVLVLVKRQFVREEEGGRAERAAVAAVSRVATPVDDEVARLGERARTQRAGEGPLARVLALVRAQVAGGHRLAAHGTGQPPCRSRCRPRLCVCIVCLHCHHSQSWDRNRRCCVRSQRCQSSLSRQSCGGLRGHHQCLCCCVTAFWTGEKVGSRASGCGDVEWSGHWQGTADAGERAAHGSMILLHWPGEGEKQLLESRD